MKTQKYRRLQISDYPEAEEWFHRALDPINRQFESVSNALEGRLTFADNFSAEVREVELQQSTDGNSETIWTTSLKVDDSITPIGVLMLWSDYLETASMAWERKQEGNVVDIRVRWNSEPNRPPAARFLIIGG